MSTILKKEIKDHFFNMSIGDVVSLAQQVGSLKTKKDEWEKLQNEIESAKLFVAQLKTLVETSASNKHITSCTLPTLMDAINALQQFMKENIQGPLNSKFWNLASPGYYRTELLSFVNNIHMEFTIYQMEMQVYWNIILDHVVSEGNLNDVQEQLQTQVQQCQRVHSAFMKRLPKMDVCPTCLQRNVNHATITERYLDEHAPLVK